jgi:long-chain acyl-CoA synthetase
MEDLKALRPTLFPSVPRLYNKIYDKVVNGANAAGGLKAALFNKGLEAKKYWLKRNYLEYGFWDKLVFSKIKARVGLDRCRLMVTGSAPIAAHVMEFLRCVFGVVVLEGYGQTECSAAATVTSINDQASLGHVGGPLACNEVRLESVPEMDYLVTDTEHGRVEEDGKVINEGIRCFGRGEVCYRGPNVFKGYFRAPDKTAEALDEDGWLHSGDVGLWDENGNLRIIDRKKNIFKLSQGEYIAAEKIENAYARSAFVGQVFVYGDSLQSCVVGIVVPDQEYLTAWAKGKGIAGDFAALCANPAVKEAIWADMKAQEKEAKLKGFEKIKALHLDACMWSVDNELLTPTFKAKRPQLKRHYQGDIDAMYASGIGVVAGQAGVRQGAV